MAVQITNNGASIKIVTGTAIRLVLKLQIRSIEVVKITYIKLDIDKGINNIFINHPDVTIPTVANADALRDAINDMLSVDSTTELAQLTAINDNLGSILTQVSSINDKSTLEPLIVDEGTPNTIYRGYALAGASTSAAVWAIEKTVASGDITTSTWAAGNKNLDKIWNNRELLTYI